MVILKNSEVVLFLFIQINRGLHLYRKEYIVEFRQFDASKYFRNRLIAFTTKRPK